MDDLISRQTAIMDAESWVAVDEYEKNLQKKVVEWLKEFPPAELGTDCISRQAAQRLFGKALTYKERIGKLAWTTSEVKQWIADCIEQLPPARPAQRTGKWIHASEEMWKCDQCGEISCCSPNFCPDCGAKMEVNHESN